MTSTTTESAHAVADAPTQGPTPAKFFIPGLDPDRDGFNVAKLITHWAEVQPDVPALMRATGRDRAGQAVFVQRTFGEFERDVHRTAHVLVRQGIRPQDRVGLFVTDGIEFITLVFALQRTGAVPVLIDPGMGVKNMVACVAEQRLDGFVGVAKAQVFRAVFGRAFEDLKVRLCVGPGPAFFAKRLETLREKLPPDVKDTPFAPHHPDKDDPATIVYTSGSTGVPKGVIYTHAMMAAQVQGVQRVGGFEPGDVHVACFMGFGLYAVGCGMTTVFPEMDMSKPGKANPVKIIAAIDASKATTAFASPALWEVMSRHVQKHSVELPRLRALFSSGAAVQPHLLERLLPAVPNGDLFTPYGATEALPIATMSGRKVLAETRAKTDAGAGTCVGTVAEDTVVKIIRITDAPLAQWSEVEVLDDGEVGEIVVRGPQVTRAYDQRPDETLKAKIKDGAHVWHRVGDVGYLDEDGALWFCGRKSHRVETKDGPLYSVPCEAVFETHAKVFRAALTWVGERPNQTPVMCIELWPKVTPSDKLLREIKDIGQACAHTRGIEHVMFHPGFPVDRRHNAKIEREKLAVWAQDKVRP